MGMWFLFSIAFFVAVVLYAIGFLLGQRACKGLRTRHVSLEKPKEKEAASPAMVTCVSCPAHPSERCSDGRCRYHCGQMCKCEDNLDLIAETAIDRAMDSVRRATRH